MELKLNQITKEDVCGKRDTEQVLIFNPFTEKFRVEYCDSKCIARNKNAVSSLMYFELGLATIQIEKSNMKGD